MSAGHFKSTVEAAIQRAGAGWPYSNVIQRLRRFADEATRHPTLLHPLEAATFRGLADALEELGKDEKEMTLEECVDRLESLSDERRRILEALNVPRKP